MGVFNSRKNVDWGDTDSPEQDIKYLQEINHEAGSTLYKYELYMVMIRKSLLNLPHLIANNNYKKWTEELNRIRKCELQCKKMEDILNYYNKKMITVAKQTFMKVKPKTN